MLPEPAVPWERSTPLVPPGKPLLELHSLTPACISSQQLTHPTVPQALILSQIQGTGHRKMAMAPPPMVLRGSIPNAT